MSLKTSSKEVVYNYMCLKYLSKREKLPFKKVGVNLLESLNLDACRDSLWRVSQDVANLVEKYM